MAHYIGIIIIVIETGDCMYLSFWTFPKQYSTNFAILLGLIIAHLLNTALTMDPYILTGKERRLPTAPGILL